MEGNHNGCGCHIYFDGGIIYLFQMTQQDIIGILNSLFVIPNVVDDRIRIDFFNGDEMLGDIYYLTNIVKGKIKPLRQKVYIMDAYDMRKVISYIDNVIPIQEGDMELIHKTINMYSQEVIEKWGRD